MSEIDNTHTQITLDAILEEMPDEAKGLASVSVFRWGSPELIAIGWAKMNVEEVTALSKIINIAAAVGYGYAQREALFGEVSDNERLIEMASDFGLNYSNLRYHGEKRTEGITS